MFQNNNILLTIAYDGTDFFGWQKQSSYKTIQGDLEKALCILFKKDDISIRGASRTDAGVHALEQLVLIKEQTKIPMEKLPRVINAIIDNKELVVIKAEYVPSEFHPQYNVYKKTYEYKIYNSQIPNPLYRNYSEYQKATLDLQKMRESCEYFLGEHDFKAFSSSGGMSKTTTRTIYDLTVQKEQDFIIINISGNGFLYNMVRIIAGTLIYIGLNKISPSDIPHIISSQDRRKAGPTSSACGLTLKKIYTN
ncbi:MAG: tRNA pseudouridine(38-40) synthase TruA [bacterium]